MLPSVSTIHTPGVVAAAQCAAPSACGEFGGSEITQPAAQTLFPNPALRLDPASGVVVIEFRDGQGEIRESLPTEAQLRRYRVAMEAGHAATDQAAVADPSGGTGHGAADAATALKTSGAGEGTSSQGGAGMAGARADVAV